MLQAIVAHFSIKRAEVLRMKESHSLSLIAAYYLSKYDETAYKELGFRSSTMTHIEIGRALGVNPNTVKNMRDEFDPLHDNQRAGWYQRPLRPSRAKVVEAFFPMKMGFCVTH